MSANGIAYWNGTEWSAVGTGDGATDEYGSRGWLRTAAMYNGSLISGGQFAKVDGVTANNVAAWVGANWHAFGTKYRIFEVGNKGGEVGTYVNALAIVGNSLFIGGKFNQAGGTAATGGLARWERAAEQWVSIDGSLGGVDGAHVRALAPSGGDLLVAGKFTTTGAAQARYVARFNTLIRGIDRISLIPPGTPVSGGIM